jgi:hypothetical protein
MTDQRNSPLSNRRALGILFAAGLAAHGLLPFLEIVVSDDWFTLLAYRTASIESAWEGAVFLSMPLTVLQALPFFLIGDNLLALRGINLLVLIANGYIFYRLLCELKAFEKREALVAAVISIVFPAYLVHFMVSFLFYPLGLLLFQSALLLVLRGEENPQHRLRYFIPAMAMVFYSFHLGALLVFYVFFIFAHFVFRLNLRKEGFVRSIISYLDQRFLFLLIPFWFWGLRQAFALFFPTWESYNQPVLDRAVLSQGVASFASSYGRMLDDLVLSPWFVFSGLIALFVPFLARLVNGPKTEHAPPSHPKMVVWFFVGASMMVTGLLPFILVGKHPQILPIEWRDKTSFDLASRQILLVIDTRMDLFTGMAVGVMCVAALGWMRVIFRLPSIVVSAVLFALITSSCAVQVANYLALEKKGIAMAALRVALQKDDSLKDTRIFGVVDRIGNISTTWDSWPLFFREVWGDMEHFGVPERWYGTELNSSLVYSRDTIINERLYGGAWHRFFKKPSFGAEQATIVLSNGPAESRLSPLGAFVRYHYYKFTSPSLLREFLADFTHVQIIPKKNAEKEFADLAFASEWRELKPRLELNKNNLHDFVSADEAPRAEAAVEVANDAGIPQLSDEEMEIIASRKVSSETFGTLGRGRVIILEFEFHELPQEDFVQSVVPIGERFGDLVSLHKLEDRKLKVFGVVPVGEKAVGYRIGGFLKVEPSKVRVFEGPANYEPTFTLIPQPFLFPEQVNPDRFVSAFSVSSREIPQVFWRKRWEPKYWPFAETSDGVVFQPNHARALLVSDLLGFDAAKPGILFVDWPTPTGVSKLGVVKVEDYKGRRLLELQPDPKEPRRFYFVPPTPNLTGISLSITSPSGGPVLLPSRLSFFQIESVTNMKTPLLDKMPQ